MKKILFLVFAAMLFSLPALAQNDSTNSAKKPKKESGFWKAIKKGVESTTGLDVSKETLFVYPTLTDWKMQLISCIGNKESGEVQIIINVMNMSGRRHQTEWCELKKAQNDAKEPLTLDPPKIKVMFDLKPNTFVEVPFCKIVNVPLTSKTISGFFQIDVMDIPENRFEFRDAPITWQ